MIKRTLKFILMVFVVTVAIVGVVSCGGQKSSSEASCTEPAIGAMISPDPSFLNQPLTITIEIPSITTVFLEYIVIRDASGNTVREFQSR